MHLLYKKATSLGSKHNLAIRQCLLPFSTATNQPKYDLFSAVCLQRLPQITPKLNIIQEAMKELMERHEVKRALYSDHELRQIEDAKRAERLAAKAEVDEKDVEQMSKQTAQEFEDKSNEELKKFVFARRETEADMKQDTKSLERLMDKYLILMTKYKQGESSKWLLPFSRHKSGDEGSLRATAESALEQFFGSAIFQHIRFMSNSPCGVYNYRYPKRLKEQLDGPHGGLIFFFKAQVTDVDKLVVTPSTLIEDWNWLSRKETRSLLQAQGNGRYWSRLSKTLLSEQTSDELVEVIIDKVKRQGVRLSEVDYRKKKTIKQS